MKHTKSFLAISAAILSLAGVAAAKYYGPTKTRFYITFAGRYCKSVPSTCTTGGIFTCFAIFIDPHNGQHWYPLYTRGTEGPYPSGTRCTSPLLFSSED